MYNCHDCKGLSVEYMVRQPVWAAAVPSKITHVKVCLHCLQARLKRQLVQDDFDFSLHINQGLLFGAQISRMAVLDDLRRRPR